MSICSVARLSVLAGLRFPTVRLYVHALQSLVPIAQKSIQRSLNFQWFFFFFSPKKILYCVK